jgi:hypothetical protein
MSLIYEQFGPLPVHSRFLFRLLRAPVESCTGVVDPVGHGWGVPGWGVLAWLGGAGAGSGAFGGGAAA